MLSLKPSHSNATCVLPNEPGKVVRLILLDSAVGASCLKRTTLVHAGLLTALCCCCLLPKWHPCCCLNKPGHDMSCTARQGHLLGAAGITAANQGKLTQEQRTSEADESDWGSLEVSSGGNTDGENSGSDRSLFGGDSSSDEEGMKALLQRDLADNGLPAEAQQGRKPLPQVTALERLLHERGGDVSTSYDELQAEPPKAQGGRTATRRACSEVSVLQPQASSPAPGCLRRAAARHAAACRRMHPLELHRHQLFTVCRHLEAGSFQGSARCCCRGE